jgi:hypothetical protein
MKQLIKMKTILLFLIFSSLVLSTSGQTGADSSTPAKKGVLIVEYDENMPNSRSASYNTINNEQDRFYYLEENAEKVFEKELSGYEFDFQLFPAKASEDANILELTMVSFYSPSPIELEIRVWVILKVDGKEKDFGITRSTIVPQRPMTSGSIERDLDKIYTDLATQIAKKIAGEL